MRPKTSEESSNDYDEDIILLTGSSGCLGFQTLKLLISNDEKTKEIRCLDLCEPSAKQRQELNAEELSRGKKLVKFIKGDIRDINLIESILNDLQVNCIIHCAAKVDIWTNVNEQDVDELEAINVSGTENLLKSCIRFGVQKFVHVSSYETFVSYHTIYYATEKTIPEPEYLLFGPSAKSKKMAEIKVKQYANNKLRPYKRPQGRKFNSSNDYLNAIIVRFTPIYGEYDKHFISHYLKLAKFFSGKLQKFSNIWIRQQPIYVGNAAWSLICAKNKMDLDESISGEDFHITDDTSIGDPFKFLQPFLECKQMQLSNSTLPGLPIWFLITLFFWLGSILNSLDVFNLFGKRRGRLEMAIEEDRVRDNNVDSDDAHQSSACSMHSVKCASESKKQRWYHLITPQIFYFTISSLFLNRTKASLRLNYEPLFNENESKRKALLWYKDHLEL